MCSKGTSWRVRSYWLYALGCFAFFINLGANDCTPTLCHSNRFKVIRKCVPCDQMIWTADATEMCILGRKQVWKIAFEGTSCRPITSHLQPDHYSSRNDCLWSFWKRRFRKRTSKMTTRMSSEPNDHHLFHFPNAKQHSTSLPPSPSPSSFFEVSILRPSFICFGEQEKRKHLFDRSFVCRVCHQIKKKKKIKRKKRFTVLTFKWPSNYFRISLLVPQRSDELLFFFFFYSTARSVILYSFGCMSRSLKRSFISCSRDAVTQPIERHHTFSSLWS